MLGTVRKAFLVVDSAVHIEQFKEKCFLGPYPACRKLSGQSDVTSPLVKATVCADGRKQDSEISH